jgi:hypothetical protein
MVLPPSLKTPSRRTLQNVIDDIEVASQYQDWSWGSRLYCLRCGEWGHTVHNHKGRRCFTKVKCDHCAASFDEKRRKACYSHRTEYCIIFAMRGPEDGVDDLAANVAGLGFGHY